MVPLFMSSGSVSPKHVAKSKNNYGLRIFSTVLTDIINLSAIDDGSILSYFECGPISDREFPSLVSTS